MAEDISSSSLHPLTPPLEEEDRLSWLRLIRSGRVGPATFHRLLSEHGTAAAAIEALPRRAAEAGISNYAPASRAQALSEMKRAKAAGSRLLPFGSADYPAALATIPDPPPILWSVGDVSLLRRRLIALVGARAASSLGLRIARKIARDLGEAGVVTVSGLARGIDTAAHLGALEGGTVAVLAGGVDVVYPPENERLARDIAELGLLVSEAPMGVQPTARHFPRRNRIVSGLAQAVVVVEAAAQSGSLITAKCALDQGREVLAVPGHPFDGRAAGCNQLIRDGAVLVRGAADILDALDLPRPATSGWPPDPVSGHRPPPDAAGDLGARILARLGTGPVSEDQLAHDLATLPERLSPALVALEIEGQIARDGSGLLLSPGKAAD